MSQPCTDPAPREAYRGTTPHPADFEAFWRMRMVEADAAPLEYQVSPSEIPPCAGCDFLDLWFRGIDGARLYAKYLRPRGSGASPLVLQFHGYPGASRSWFEQASFAGMGYALLALDCPGQGGFGEDRGGYTGPTVSGHLVAGLGGDPKTLYYTRFYQNMRVLCRIVRQLPGIDLSHVYVNGASQGGGLGLVCTALNPDLVRGASILYPFLSDFQKAWELGAEGTAYAELAYYCRWQDPAGERTAEIFTKLGYIDVINFAPMVKAPVLFGTGLADTVCPPCTQDAVYHRLTCPKRRYLYPDFGHEEIQAFDDLIVGFYEEEEAACLL